MKKIRINKTKFKARISELIIIISTILITSKAIEYADSIRRCKCKAYGGEYLIPILGLLLIVIIEDRIKK